MSILPDKLLSFEYYENKLPLFLRQSESFKQHFKIWFDLLRGDKDDDFSGLVPSADQILALLNIFDKNYLDTINSLDGNDDGTISDMLDKLATLFGISRKFSVSYIDETSLSEINDELTLNNEELLLFIRFQVARAYCEGTTEQFQEFYKNAGLNVYIVTSEIESAQATFYLIDVQDELTYSDNIKKMFLAGLLRIDSMGVSYKDRLRRLSGFLVWDAPAATKQGWDRGTWSI